MNNNALSKSTGRRLRLLLLLASFALLATACNKAANSNNSNTSSSNTTGATNTSSTSPATSSANPALSPTATYKAFQEANKRKDYEAFKKHFSKGSLALISEEAKKQNKTVDDFVKEQVDTVSHDEQVTGEQINGDSAIVELKDENSSIKLPMVKEDGEWKIAYDVFLNQLKEAFEQMGKEADKAGKDSQGSDNHNVNK
jgi:hypothetical protein